MDKTLRSRDIKIVHIGNSLGSACPKSSCKNTVSLIPWFWKKPLRGFSSGRNKTTSSPGLTPIRPWPMRGKTGASMTRHCLTDWRMTTLTPKRYEIYFADLNPTLGSEISKIRPVVIISDDAMNTYLETVVICPITSKIHPTWRTRFQITCVDKQAEVAVDQIRTISKTRLKKKIDQLPDDDASQLRRIITEMYGE